MPRTPRLVIPGLPHHITQRGNYRQQVFFGDGDREFFLDRLEARAAIQGLDVLGWCLMRNHFHLIAVPHLPGSLACTLRPLLSEYSMRVNALHNQVRGHLWQSRFYSCALEGGHLWRALRYVELNPVRAHLTQSADVYEWSSARYHLGLKSPPALLRMSPWNEHFSIETWREALQGTDETSDAGELRRCTGRGRPWGNTEFLESLEKQLGRQFRPRPVGRPPRKHDDGDGEQATAAGSDRQLSFAVD